MEHMKHKKSLFTSMREIAGVHHPKWFVSDNDLMISGASQGSDLFLDRKDRYWVIRDCKELCDYAMDNLQVFFDYSYQVNNNGELEFPSSYPQPDSRT
jgi:CDP-diacylglycerol--glycerol-3-phosphate 3-phosphatidyltransferase